jgi:hypothetical protein
LTEFVPTNQHYFLSCIEALPNELSLKAFDSGKYKLRSGQCREGVDWKGLEDGLEKSEAAGKIKSSVGPGGEPFGEGR